jgi:hypothetical protein
VASAASTWVVSNVAIGKMTNTPNQATGASADHGADHRVEAVADHGADRDSATSVIAPISTQLL